MLRGISSVGDWKSAEIDKRCMNAFIASIIGNADFGSRGPSFHKAGYKYANYPKFNIRDETEESDEVAKPDVLLYNVSKKCALLIEVKGEDSIGTDRHLRQLKRNKSVGEADVEKLVKAIDCEVTIDNLITGIVYREETVQKCYQSQTCFQKLNQMQQDYLVCTQRRGGYLKALNPQAIVIDDELRGFLTNGIPIPKKPKIRMYVTENPCVKGIMYGILDYIQDEFFSEGKIQPTGENREIFLTTVFLKDEVFKEPHVNSDNIATALRELKTLGFCTYTGKKPRFGFQWKRFNRLMSSDRRQETINKINSLDCSNPSKTLDSTY